MTLRLFCQGEASLSRVYATASGKTSILGGISPCEKKKEVRASSSKELEARTSWTDEEAPVWHWIRRKRARAGEKCCSHQMMLDSVASGCAARADVQLVVERAHVGLDG
jgi:hypothetical protein